MLIAQRRNIPDAAADAIDGIVVRRGKRKYGAERHLQRLDRDDEQRPDVFAAAFAGAKAAVDQKAIMNPGVLIDPPRDASAAEAAAVAGVAGPAARSESAAA